VTISRRAFLGGLLATAACSSSGGDDAGAPATTGTTAGDTVPPAPAADLPSNPFTLGVASGDPDTTSVLLWTRLLPDAGPVEGDVPVRWDVLDADGRIVASAEVVAEARWGHSVHALAEGLDPGTRYRYRFRTGEHTSPEGTTRTAPADDDESPVALAAVSCQRYDDGFFAAHRDIAAADLDLVVFLGDYVYESAQRADPVRPLPARPDAVADLAGYRSRYEAARRDADLAAAHAAHPWVVTWDDHEVANDHTGTTVDPARRAAAYQAWWEHMPVRMPPPAANALAVHREVRWGALVDLLVLDTRQHRSAAPCGGGVVEASCADRTAAGATMLGAEQEAWLLDRLPATEAAWAVLAQSVLLSSVELLGQVNADAWDGFPASRDAVVVAVAERPDVVVLTGDLHVQLVADVRDGAGTTVASELVAPSVTSRIDEQLAPAVALLPTIAEAVRFADGDRRGWLRGDVDADRWLATYREVLDVADPASAVVDGPRFEITRGAPGAARI